MTSSVLYSAQYHRQHYTLQAFEQIGALYMQNHDDKYPTRPRSIQISRRPAHNIGIQMNPKELTKIFMMISN